MAKERKDNELSAAARTLGRKGGKVGGKARAEKLPAQRRQAIARSGGEAAAAKARVKGKKK